MTTPGSPDGGTAKPRRAATERAMRRRERRLGPRAPQSAPAEPPPSTRDRTTAPRGRVRAAQTARDRRERRERRVTREPVERPVRPRRPSHTRVLVRRWVALAVVLGVAALVVTVLWTPVFGVRSVDVAGTRNLTPAQVEAAADIRPGTPMLRLDSLGIIRRVALLPRVATVDVSREWPSTVLITVTERDPIGVIAAPDGTHLVDDTGYDYAVVPAPPAGLPRLQLPLTAASDPRVQAVVQVLAALPAQLKAELTTVGAATPGSVTMTLANGKIIRWGDARQSARKSAVLAALMTRPGKVYDVSSPDLPTISS